jgi:hypothetical protein
VSCILIKIQTHNKSRLYSSLKPPGAPLSKAPGGLIVERINKAAEAICRRYAKDLTGLSGLDIPPSNSPLILSWLAINLKAQGLSTSVAYCLGFELSSVIAG